ncbi:MAG: helix-turn-helix transcriptional regulator [Ruminococcaceae bacterium]|nr:helix-turn-helix transcriptional regulator [Oscillospiraceae bacterium]
MTNRLVSDIKSYLEYLEEKNIYVSIHTKFSEYMLPLLEYNLHKNPRCLVVKSDNAAWDRCIRCHGYEKLPFSLPETRVCHAGVEEIVFPLDFGGSVCVSASERIEKTVLVTMINPLCRMIEYLNILCPENEAEITDSELVNRMIKFIQRNYYNPLSNDDIARACSCSVSTVCHLFRKHMGMSVHRYIDKLRLDYACELLKASNISVASVARKSGFSDYNYFSLKFRKKYEMSASRYRKLYREK